MSGIEFTSEEQERYSRHFVLPDVGVEGQSKLKAARVLIVGAGGLGSPVALYLAAVGVGTIGIVDHDVVSLSNLQRQILYSSADVGKSKALVARERILSLNPTLKVVVYQERLDSSNALGILREFDIIADCTDNFPTRYLINDACVLASKVNVYGSVFRHEGQVSVFDASHGPCYRCLYPAPPPPELVQDCAQAGVLGVLTGIVGTLQANEIIKQTLGNGKSLAGRLLMVDALNATTQEIAVEKDPACPVCGENRSITLLIDYEEFCMGNSSPDKDSSQFEISVKELKQRLGQGQSIALLDVREPFEQQLCSLGGQLIPLRELDQRKEELNRESEIIVYCHHGMRSQSAVNLLRRSGFSNVKNLDGGIDAWAREIDKSMPRY